MTQHDADSCNFGRGYRMASPEGNISAKRPIVSPNTIIRIIYASDSVGLGVQFRRDSGELIFSAKLTKTSSKVAC